MNVRFYQVECKIFQNVFYCSVCILYKYKHRWMEYQMAVSDGSVLKEIRLKSYIQLEKSCIQLEKSYIQLEKSYIQLEKILQLG